MEASKFGLRSGFSFSLSLLLSFSLVAPSSGAICLTSPLPPVRLRDQGPSIRFASIYATHTHTLLIRALNPSCTKQAQLTGVHDQFARVAPQARTACRRQARRAADRYTAAGR